MKKFFMYLAAAVIALPPLSHFTLASSEGEKKAETLYTLLQQILNKEPEKRENNTKLLVAMFTPCASSHKNAVIKEACGIVLPKLEELFTGTTLIIPTIETPITSSLNSSRFPGCDTDDITIGEYIIAACNVGAVKAGLGQESYGNYFQRGNNYGRSYNIDPSYILENSSDQEIDILLDGPSRYNNPIRIRKHQISNAPKNLRGDIVNTDEARQGPCSDGYHVPSAMEWEGVIKAMQIGNNSNLLSTKLKLPYTGFRGSQDAKIYQDGERGFYLSSTPSSITNGYMYRLHFVKAEIAKQFGQSQILPQNHAENGDGYTVRCFKN